MCPGSPTGIITRQAIRRGTIRSVNDLPGAIGRSIDAYNGPVRAISPGPRRPVV
jgi:hypothetical protein